MMLILTAFIRGFKVPVTLFFYLIFLYPFKKSYKKRLLRALESCGPVFIKCGQSISLKPYLFSSETIDACSNLQDKVSPGKIIFTKDIENIFENIDKTPIASGSIACVFKGKLKTGENVAVKILRKNTEKLIKADILLLKAGSFLLEFLPVFKKFKIRSVVSSIEKTLLDEIDFTKEENNLFKLKENCFKIHPKIKIPKVFTKFTTKSLLITEFIEDIPLSNIQKIQESKLDTKKIAKNLVEIYLHQVYEDGFFHADFHPGNIFVNQNYEITLVDFGIVSEISYHDRIVIAKILNGFLVKNYDDVLNAHIEGGYVSQNINTIAFKEDLEKIGEAFIHSGIVQKFSISGILMELFRIMETYNIEVKEDLLLLYKTIFFVEAVVMKLEPEYNIWAVIKPWMKSWRRRNIGILANFLNLLETFNIQNVLKEFKTCVRF